MRHAITTTDLLTANYDWQPGEDQPGGCRIPDPRENVTIGRTAHTGWSYTTGYGVSMSTGVIRDTFTIGDSSRTTERVKLTIEVGGKVVTLALKPADAKRLADSLANLVK